MSNSVLGHGAPMYVIYLVWPHSMCCGGFPHNKNKYWPKLRLTDRQSKTHLTDFIILQIQCNLPFSLKHLHSKPSAAVIEPQKINNNYVQQNTNGVITSSYFPDVIARI